MYLIAKQEETVTPDVLKEMFGHMTDMDRVITSFHDSFEQIGNRWKVSKSK